MVKFSIVSIVFYLVLILQMVFLITILLVTKVTKLLPYFLGFITILLVTKVTKLWLQKLQKLQNLYNISHLACSVFLAKNSLSQSYTTFFALLTHGAVSSPTIICKPCACNNLVTLPASPFTYQVLTFSLFW